MKTFIVVLLAFLALSQARTALKVHKAEPELSAPGENPYVVHLRMALATSGYLRTRTGNLINNRWVLTAASAVEDQRFIWLRFGALSVMKPELVIESSTVRVHPSYYPFEPLSYNFALININRDIEFTENIAPIRLQTNMFYLTPSTGKICAYGAGLDGLPFDSLRCVSATVVPGSFDIITGYSDQADATPYDIGSALVDDNDVAFAILVSDPPLGADYSARYLRITAVVNRWIMSEVLEVSRDRLSVSN